MKYRDFKLCVPCTDTEGNFCGFDYSVSKKITIGDKGFMIKNTHASFTSYHTFLFKDIISVYNVQTINNSHYAFNIRGYSIECPGPDQEHIGIHTINQDDCKKIHEIILQNTSSSKMATLSY